MGDILGIIGSPRIGGNTDVLVTEVLRSAAESGVSGQVVHLADLNIRECIGCHACWKDGVCLQDDDMCDLYRRIAEAKALVLGSPVYWYGPTALLKAFIDRLVYFNCPETRKLIAGKPAAIVSPFEEEDPGVADLLFAMVERSLAYLQMPVAGCLGVPGVTKRGEVAQVDWAMQAARDLGRKLAERITA